MTAPDLLVPLGAHVPELLPAGAPVRAPDTGLSCVIHEDGMSVFGAWTEAGQTIKFTSVTRRHVKLDLSAPTIDSEGRASHVDFLPTALGWLGARADGRDCLDSVVRLLWVLAAIRDGEAPATAWQESEHDDPPPWWPDLSGYSRLESDEVTHGPSLSRNFGGRSWRIRYCPWCGASLVGVRG